MPTGMRAEVHASPRATSSEYIMEAADFHCPGRRISASVLPHFRMSSARLLRISCVPYSSACVTRKGCNKPRSLALACNGPTCAHGCLPSALLTHNFSRRVWTAHVWSEALQEHYLLRMPLVDDSSSCAFVSIKCHCPSRSAPAYQRALGCWVSPRRPTAPLAVILAGTDTM